MILVGPPVVKGHCKMSRKTIKHRVPDVKRQFLSMTSVTIDVSGMVRAGRTGGARGATGPPEFFRFSTVELSQSSLSNRGLIVLAPPDFFYLPPALMVILDLMGSIKPINVEKLFIQPKNVWESSTLMYLSFLAEQYFGN